MEETVGTADVPPEEGVIDEIESTVKQAAAGAKVVLIRISVGKAVTISRVRIAKELNRRFPDASLEIIEEKSNDDSIVVKDIEVE